MRYSLQNIWLHWYGTAVHKFWVLLYSVDLALRILWRGLTHDNSKYSLEESVGFFRVIKNLQTLEYGSPEYMKNLDDIKDSIAAHYRKNRHHPEHHEEGIKDFNLVDLVEMFCDWRAAVKRTRYGCMDKSLEVNKKRFKMSDDIVRIYKNTVDE